MLFLISAVLAVCFAWFCAKPLKSHPIPFYIGGIVCTTALISINLTHISGIPQLLTQWVFPVFTKGILAAALWCLVAYIGALPNGSKAIKKLMPIRGELSIFAAVITLSHAVTYGVTYIRRLISGRSDFSFIVSFIVCLSLTLIMLPLTIISFKAIRKKMNAKLWKKIQRFAYLFYALIYVHIFVIYLQKPVTNANKFSLVLYTAAFFGYAAMRIRKHYIIKKKPQKKGTLNTVCLAAVCLITVSPAVFLRSAEQKPVQTAHNDNATVSSDNTHSDKTESSVISSVSSSAIIQSTPQSAADTISEPNSKEETSNSEAALSETSQTEEHNPVQSSESKPEPKPEPQPTYVYKNGTYTASAFGYDGDVTVTITISNDTITELTAKSDESDTWYFDSAYSTVRGRILGSQNTTVDAVSGATYSSNAIMQAAKTALNSARN